MSRGNWDDISSAQRAALRKIRDLNRGVHAGNLRGVGLPTLRALHRYGLIQCADSFIQSSSIVVITPHGADSISGDP